VVDLRTLQAGDTLFKAGEPGDSLFVVRSGEVELFIKDKTGQKIVLTIAGCAIWSIAFVLVGALAGAAWRSVAGIAGQVSLAVAALVLLACARQLRSS